MNNESPDSQPVQIFCSYSHADQSLLHCLEKHLAGLTRKNLISLWYDGRLVASDRWRNEILDRLTSARIVLLLVSSDFLASDYCRIETELAMERHAKNRSMVIPIILRPCDWEEELFAELQILPARGKPVTLWEDQDAAFLDVAKGIRAAVLTIEPQLGSAQASIKTTLAAKSVLIGDSDLYRFQYLQQMIEGTLRVQAIHAKTFLQIANICEQRAKELKLILFTEGLPYSDQILPAEGPPYSGQEKSIPLKTCFQQLIRFRLRAGCAAKVGLVYENIRSVQDFNTDECDLFVPFPDSDKNIEDFLKIVLAACH